MLYPDYCVGIFKGRHFLTQDLSKPSTQTLVKVAIYNKQGSMYLIHHAKENEFHLPSQILQHNEQPIEVAQTIANKILGKEVETTTLQPIGQIRYYQYGQLFMVHYMALLPTQTLTTLPTHHYRVQTLSLPDSECGFGIQVEETITDDREDILHTFLDSYYCSIISKSTYANDLVVGEYNYDHDQIKTQESYAVCFNPNSLRYTIIPISQLHQSYNN